MSTTVIAAKAGLASLLAATYAADQPPVTVLDGPRGTVTFTTGRIVSIGNVTGTSQADAMDLATQEERYTVEITVSVSLPGADTMPTARAAALDIWQRGEVAVREHPTGDLGLSAAGVLGVRVAPEFALTETAFDQGRVAAVRWGVFVIGQRT